MPQRLLDLDIYTGELQQLELELGATPHQTERALVSTINRMARWLRTRSARGLSKELDMPQKALRKRLKTIRFSRGKGSAEVDVWYGLNPISFIDLKPRKTATGIKAGKRAIKGGFVGVGKSGNRHAFKRRGKARLPIDKQSVEIHNESIRFIDDELLGSSEFDSAFLTTFERELKWRTQTRK